MNLESTVRYFGIEGQLQPEASGCVLADLARALGPTAANCQISEIADYRNTRLPDRVERLKNTSNADKSLQLFQLGHCSPLSRRDRIEIDLHEPRPKRHLFIARQPFRAQ